MMPKDMTAEALARRADEVVHEDTVNTYLTGEDEREITLFFKWEDCDLDGEDPDSFTVPGFTRNMIGATLGDQVLTRDEMREMFSGAQVIAWEGDAFEREGDYE
jgi:hypothetical protein